MAADGETMAGCKQHVEILPLARRDLGHGVILETGQERGEIAVKDVQEYLWHLRVLAHAWTMCGNYKVKGTDQQGKECDTLYCTHGDAFGYVDRVTRKVMVLHAHAHA